MFLLCDLNLECKASCPQSLLYNGTCINLPLGIISWSHACTFVQEVPIGILLPDCYQTKLIGSVLIVPCVFKWLLIGSFSQQDLMIVLMMPTAS